MRQKKMALIESAVRGHPAPPINKARPRRYGFGGALSKESSSSSKRLIKLTQ